MDGIFNPNEASFSGSISPPLKASFVFRIELPVHSGTIDISDKLFNKSQFQKLEIVNTETEHKSEEGIHHIALNKHGHIIPLPIQSELIEYGRGSKKHSIAKANESQPLLNFHERPFNILSSYKIRLRSSQDIIIKDTEPFEISEEEKYYWSQVLPLPSFIKSLKNETQEDKNLIILRLAEYMRSNYRYINHKDIGEFISKNKEDLPIIVDELKHAQCHILSNWTFTVYLRQLGIIAFGMSEISTNSEGTKFSNNSGHAKTGILADDKLIVFDPTKVCEIAPSFLPKNLSKSFIELELNEKYKLAESEIDKRNVLRNFLNKVLESESPQKTSQDDTERISTSKESPIVHQAIKNSSYQNRARELNLSRLYSILDFKGEEIKKLEEKYKGKDIKFLKDTTATNSYELAVKNQFTDPTVKSTVEDIWFSTFHEKLRIPEAVKKYQEIFHKNKIYPFQPGNDFFAPTLKDKHQLIDAMNHLSLFIAKSTFEELGFAKNWQSLAEALETDKFINSGLLLFFANTFISDVIFNKRQINYLNTSYFNEFEFSKHFCNFIKFQIQDLKDCSKRTSQFLKLQGKTLKEVIHPDPANKDNFYLSDNLKDSDKEILVQVLPFLQLSTRAFKDKALAQELKDKFQLKEDFWQNLAKWIAPINTKTPKFEVLNLKQWIIEDINYKEVTKFIEYYKNLFYSAKEDIEKAKNNFRHSLDKLIPQASQIPIEPSFNWDIKEYRPGLPIKKIAWRASAKYMHQGQLYVCNPEYEGIKPSLHIYFDNLPCYANNDTIENLFSLESQEFYKNYMTVIEVLKEKLNFFDIWISSQNTNYLKLNRNHSSELLSALMLSPPISNKDCTGKVRDESITIKTQGSRAEAPFNSILITNSEGRGEAFKKQLQGFQGTYDYICLREIDAMIIDLVKDSWINNIKGLKE